MQRFCEEQGIRAVPVGPVVYYAGFTRSFLAGNEGTRGDTSGVRLQIVRLKSVWRLID